MCMPWRDRVYAATPPAGVKYGKRTDMENTMNRAQNQPS